MTYNVKKRSKTIDPGRLEEKVTETELQHTRKTRGGQAKDAKVELQNHHVEPDGHKVATDVFKHRGKIIIKPDFEVTPET